MANLTKQKVLLTGLNPTFASASGGGDEIVDNDGNTFLYVKNGGGSSINVTITSVKTSLDVVGYGEALTLSDEVVAVPAGEERAIGPFPKVRFDDTDENVAIAYSDVTSVTVAAIQLVT